MTTVVHSVRTPAGVVHRSPENGRITSRVGHDLVTHEPIVFCSPSTKESIMNVRLLVGVIVSLAVTLQRTQRDERGLSQSTESAILIAAAVTVGTAIVIAVTAYVTARLPK